MFIGLARLVHYYLCCPVGQYQTSRYLHFNPVRQTMCHVGFCGSQQTTNLPPWSHDYTLMVWLLLKQVSYSNICLGFHRFCYGCAAFVGLLCIESLGLLLDWCWLFCLSQVYSLADAPLLSVRSLESLQQRLQILALQSHVEAIAASPLLSILTDKQTPFVGSGLLPFVLVGIVAGSVVLFSFTLHWF